MNDTLKGKIGAYLAINGLNKSDLARKLNISEASFHNKWNGVTEFKWSEICKLGEILGCSVSDFVEEKASRD